MSAACMCAGLQQGGKNAAASLGQLLPATEGMPSTLPPLLESPHTYMAEAGLVDRAPGYTAVEALHDERGSPGPSGLTSEGLSSSFASSTPSLTLAGCVFELAQVSKTCPYCKG